MRKLKHEEIPRYTEEKLESLPKHPIVLILENIRSAENVGSIFRTSDAFRLKEVVLVGITPTPDNSKLYRSALGSQDVVKWQSRDNSEAIIAELKQAGYTIAALEITDQPKKAKSLASNNFPICLVIGNEVEGISSDTLTLCDLALEIEQYGLKQSLNVAVATGICCSDLVDAFRTMKPADFELPPNPRSE